MNFVNVASNIHGYNVYESDIVKSTKHSLISIISGLSQKEFGFDTLHRAIYKIRQYHNIFIKIHKSKLYIDSGGYSFIVGDIHPNDITKMIECYHKYLVDEQNNYDYIFSLDIPISLKYFDFNTCDNIYKYNKESLFQSREIIKTNSNIRNKFKLIWHFKILKQYKIWSKIIDELELNKYIVNRAVGGMVGLRGIVPIKFCPFIGIFYKNFFDYLNHLEYTDCDFRIHALGIYIKTDRLIMVILEKLFRFYQQQENIKKVSYITYDSINYMRTAQLKVKELSYFDYDTRTYYKDQYNIPDEIWNRIYTDTDMIKAEIELLKQNKKITNIQAFVPLYVQSNLNIDKLFGDIVDEYKIIEYIINSKNYNTFKNLMNSIILSINSKYPYLFTNTFINNMIISLKYVYAFHSWFAKNRNPENLEVLVTNTIKNINFPFDLEGVVT